jgi:hypothetical protein
MSDERKLSAFADAANKAGESIKVFGEALAKTYCESFREAFWVLSWILSPNPLKNWYISGALWARKQFPEWVSLW